MSAPAIILLGDPAAGKATQAVYLTKKYKLVDFDMGQQLRQRQQKNHLLAKAQKQTAEQGKLTPTKFVREILKEVIQHTPLHKPILFNGHPKMIGEMKLVNKLLLSQVRPVAAVLYIKIPESEIVERMLGRSTYFEGKYSKRADDTVAALQHRFRYYRKNIAQVLKFCQHEYPYYEIDGLGTRLQVKSRIMNVLDPHMEQYASQIIKKSSKKHSHESFSSEAKK